MKFISFPSPSRCFFACAALAVLAPATALAVDAPSCELECGQGFVCELLPQACPLILCLDESDPSCPRCDGAPVPQCAPAPCESDADCGGGTVCAEHTVFVDCPIVAPTPGDARSSEQKAAADAPEGTECTPTLIQQCTPRWQLPCEVDADCGAGFRCEEQQSCSVPAAPADPDARERAANVEVICEPSGVFACVVVETPCASDADCPAQFVCAENPSRSCSSDAYGRTDCDPAGEGKLCAPLVTAVANGASGAVLADATATNALPDRADAPAGDSDASSGVGGCAMSAPSSSGSFPALFAALGLAATFAARRKRRAAVA